MLSLRFILKFNIVLVHSLLKTSILVKRGLTKIEVKIIQNKAIWINTKKIFLMSKSLIIFLFLICSTFQLFAQKNDEILMKVGKADVTVGEFRYIYEKNNGQNADYSEASLKEYLDLYTKFKLKVEKAKEIKLDTINALITELDGYRKQLAGSYLIDKEVTEFLLKELYDRMKFDVEFSHIFVPVAENASLSVRNEAKTKLKDVKTKIIAGMTFENAAVSFSEDRNTAIQGGTMGYFTAKLPSGFYDLESAIYNQPIGQVSDIVESKIGYHLIKVTNKRPSRGSIEIAHILIDPMEEKTAKNVYNLLRAGNDFGDLVSKYSIDKSSSSKGGILPVFGINTYDRLFEDAAYSLKNTGDFSQPVPTKSGWHIIKLINKPAPDSYDLFVKKMRSQINKDQRFDLAKLKLINDIKKASGYKEYLNELDRFTASLTDDFYSYRWTPDNSSNSDKILCSFGGSQNFTIGDFADFCKKNTKTRLKYDKSKPVKETVDEIFNDFVKEKAMEFEEQSLPVKYPDFRSLMREYEEGILLFEVTKMNVWDKANQDTIGLKQYFNNNQNNYKWAEKGLLNIFTISSSDIKIAEKIYSYAKANEVSNIEKKFNGKSKVVVITSIDCEAGSKECQGIAWKKGALTELKSDVNSYSFTKLSAITPARNKTLSDARGYVVADYQDYLEKEWINQLSKEYKVVLNQDVINKLKK